MTTWASSRSEPVPTSPPGRNSGGELPGEMTQVRSRTNLGAVAARVFVNGPITRQSSCGCSITWFTSKRRRPLQRRPQSVSHAAAQGPAALTTSFCGCLG